MKTSRAWTTLLVASVLLVAGCATPERRISRNPEAFAKLTPEEQQMIREGKVGIGFTAEMVKLALGEPDRTYTRTDEAGTSLLWVYATYETDEGAVLFRGYYHRYWCDPLYYPYYMNNSGRRERDAIKVTFTGGRVSAIERLD